MDKFEENIMFFVHDTFFYKDIIDSLPFGLAALNSEGKIYYANKAWKECFKRYAGLDDSDFYGEDVAILFEEIFLDRDVNDHDVSSNKKSVESIIIKLRDAIFNENSKQEINFEAIIDNELRRFRVLVFTFHGINEKRDKKDKIILLEN